VIVLPSLENTLDPTIGTGTGTTGVGTGAGYGVGVGVGVGVGIGTGAGVEEGIIAGKIDCHFMMPSNISLTNDGVNHLEGTADKVGVLML